MATLRTVWDDAGLITQGGLGPLQGNGFPVGRLLFETAPVLRQGAWLVEDRGFVEGETLPVLQQQRHGDVMVPLQSTMVAYHEAVQLAKLHSAWQPHPSRDSQHMACVKGVDHVWDACQVPLKACVIRYWNRKRDILDYIVFVTTAQRLTGPWIVRHDEERPEIEQDYKQMKKWRLAAQEAECNTLQ